MSTQNLGIVSPVPMGEWSASVAYNPLNIVRSGNSSYIAKSANTNIQPNITAGWESYWMELNEDGEVGTQGPQGAQGEGVPTGGLTGQLLEKSSNSNYATGWIPQNQVNAGSAITDAQGNNIPNTYETKQHAQQTYETKTDAASKNTNLQSQITQNSQLISKESKRIDGLEARISPSPFVTDSEDDYVKDVPLNAVGSVEVISFGGITYKNTSAKTLSKVIVTGVKSIGSNLLDISQLSSYDATVVSINAETGVFSFQNIAQNQTTGVKADVFLPAGQYFISGSLVASNGMPTGSAIYDIERNSFVVNNASTTTTYGFTISESKVYSVRFYAPYTAPVGTTITGTQIRINRGNESLPYSPYQASVLNANTQIVPTYYGDGVDGESSNQFVFQENGVVLEKNSERIVLTGSESVGTYSSSEAGYYIYQIPLITASMNPSQSNVIAVCNSFNYVSFGYASASSGECISIDSSGTILFFKTNAYSTVQQFKQYLTTESQNGTPVTVVYKVKQKSTIDASGMISLDNLLPIEGGGIVVLENTGKNPAASVLEYITREN
jgi:hypothetical protein